MPKSTYLTHDEKVKIDEMRNRGKTQVFMAQEIRRSRCVVQNYLKGPQTYGEAIKSSGRKPSIAERTKRRIKRLAANQFTSIKSIKSKISTDISMSSIRNVIINSGIQRRAIKTKPILSKRHTIKRLAFVKSMLEFGPSYHKNIVFSDEKVFHLDGPNRYLYYWHDLRREEIYATTKLRGPKLMVWAAISFSDGFQFKVVSEKINSSVYQKVLDEKLNPPFFKPFNIFQQDNARPHVSKSTMDWLISHNHQYLDWPAISPDLNIIENVWGILVRRLFTDQIVYNNIGELKEAVLNEMKNIGQETINNLYKSFTNRCIEVVLAKGKFLK